MRVIQHQHRAEAQIKWHQRTFERQIQHQKTQAQKIERENKLAKGKSQIFNA